jgi:hypothetical protein
MTMIVPRNSKDNHHLSPQASNSRDMTRGTNSTPMNVSVGKPNNRKIPPACYVPACIVIAHINLTARGALYLAFPVIFDERATIPKMR